MKRTRKILELAAHTIFPVERNKNVPHILKHTSIAAIFFVVFGLFIFTNKNFEISQRLDLTATVYPAVLADLTNKDRQEEGVKELTWNETLAQAAKLKAEDMIKNEYFAHTSPQGISPWYWLAELKYNFSYAGENLAIRFSDSDDVQDAWLNSPSHRANILNSKFTQMGIAAVDGVFQGKETTVVVEFFGTPAFSNVSNPPAPIPVAVTPPVVVIAPTFTTVAGAEEENPPIKKPTTNPKPKIVNPPVETIEEGETFLVVKNTEPVTEVAVEPPSRERSAWYQRLIVNPTNTVKSIYILIIAALLASMSLMLFKEYEKHHLKHFSMGISLVVVVTFLWYFISPGSLYLV